MKLKSINNLLIVFLFFFNFNLIVGQDNNQDLFNLKNSEKYAKYLLESHQYKLAAEEFERLIFLDSINLTYKNDLIKSYYLSGNKDFALSRIKSIYQQDKIMPSSISYKYLILLQNNDSIQRIYKFIKINDSLSNYDKKLFGWGNLMLTQAYKGANEMINNEQLLSNNKKVKELTTFALQQKRKSPFLAGAMSAVVPGLGKVYTKNGLDGLFSFIFVLGNAYQSYLGFHKNGNKSVTGWVFGSIGTGFYLGNIFGSVKSAKKYNKDRENETKHRVKHYFYVHYF